MKGLQNLNKFLEKRQIKNFVSLVVLMFVATILEIFLLKFLFEFLNLFSDKDNSSNFFLLKFFSNFKINENQIFIFILLIFITYLVKTIVNLFINWKKGNFIFRVKEELSLKFLKGYLYMPRIFHLRSNTSQLIKNITSEVDSLMVALLSISNVFLESMILFGLIIFLLFFNFQVTVICLFLFITFSLILSFFNSKKTVLLGKKRVTIVEQRLKNIIESLTGSKAYELSGTRSNAISVFEKNNKQLSEISIESFFRNSAPKPLFELFTALVVTLFLLFIYGKNPQLKSIAPTAVVFFAAAYRLIPSFSTISSSMQKYQYNIQSLNNLLIDSVKFEKTDDQKKSKLNFENKIIFKNVYFSYNLKNENISDKFVLENINFDIPQGSKIGIIGESGSGKSTLLDILMGLLNPSKGNVKVDDRDIHNDKQAWQMNIGCVPQDVFILDDTLKNNIAFGIDSNLIEDSKIDETIKQASLTDLVKSLDNGVETMIGERGERISGGQKQRVGIARALYSKPDILILDEPTSALDLKTQERIVKEIFRNNKDKTIVFVSHDKRNLIDCDKVYRLENKKLTAIV